MHRCLILLQDAVGLAARSATTASHPSERNGEHESEDSATQISAYKKEPKERKKTADKA